MTAHFRNHNPVWDVYDEWRTSRLSCKYYASRVAAVEGDNLKLEFTLAITTSGSAIAAWTFWKTGDGKLAWAALTGLSAVFGVLKPLLKLTERIQKLNELAVGYALLDHDYKKLAVAINQAKAYGPSLQEQFRVLMDRTDDLKKKEVIERRIDQTLRRRCQNEVDSELPSDKFYIPPE